MKGGNGAAANQANTPASTAAAPNSAPPTPVDTKAAGQSNTAGPGGGNAQKGAVQQMGKALGTAAAPTNTQANATSKPACGHGKRGCDCRPIGMR